MSKKITSIRGKRVTNMVPVNAHMERGDLVQDIVTGEAGICVAETWWLQGCRRLVVQRQGLDKDNKPYEAHSHDEGQLKLVKKNVVPCAGPRVIEFYPNLPHAAERILAAAHESKKGKKKPTGGPRPETSSSGR